MVVCYAVDCNRAQHKKRMGYNLLFSLCCLVFVNYPGIQIKQMRYSSNC